MKVKQFKHITKDNIVDVLLYFKGNLSSKRWHLFYGNDHKLVLDWLAEIGVAKKVGKNHHRVLTCDADTAMRIIYESETMPPDRDLSNCEPYRVVYCPSPDSETQPLFKQGTKFKSADVLSKDAIWPNGIIFEHDEASGQVIQVMWYQGRVYDMEKIGGRI